MRLVGFDQGRVTLELDAEECLSLSRACQSMLRADSGVAGSEPSLGTLAERLRFLGTYRSLSRALLACARVGRRQRHMLQGVGTARPLSISAHRRPAIVAVD